MKRRRSGAADRQASFTKSQAQRQMHRSGGSLAVGVMLIAGGALFVAGYAMVGSQTVAVGVMAALDRK